MGRDQLGLKATRRLTRDLKRGHEWFMRSQPNKQIPPKTIEAIVELPAYNPRTHSLNFGPDILSVAANSVRPAKGRIYYPSSCHVTVDQRVKTPAPLELRSDASQNFDGRATRADPHIQRGRLLIQRGKESRDDHPRCCNRFHRRLTKSLAKLAQ